MKHYKDSVTNEIHAFEPDGSQDEYIQPTMVPYHRATKEDGTHYEMYLDTPDEHGIHQPDLPVIDELKEKRDKYQWKQGRSMAVDLITVTTASGKVFDGDETSQNRMARAIIASDSPEETTLWVLNNDEAVEVSVTELKEALKLAGQQQTALWVE